MYNNILIMEKKKYSLPDHENIDAVVYCQECKIYMCTKCKRNHSGLFINHHQLKLDENIKDNLYLQAFA